MENSQHDYLFKLILIGTEENKKCFLERFLDKPCKRNEIGLISTPNSLMLITN